MGDIDRQRVTGVLVLEKLGYRFDGREWQAPAEPPHWPEADALHGLLMDRVEALAGCIEDSEEEDELKAIADVLDAYEARRWPRGKIEGGKG